jgi:HEAT repeat protein
VDGLAEIMGKLPWESRQKQMVDLLASPDNLLAKAVARMLIEQPVLLDTAILTSGFSRQPPRTRRLYCAILSRVPQQTEATRKLLLQASQDQTDGVRWQAVLAIGKLGWNDKQSQSALLAALNDSNQFVGAAAAYSLTQLKATDAAPVLFGKLKLALAASNASPAILQQQASEITREFRGEENHLSVLDPERLEGRLYVNPEVAANFKRMAAMRLPPRPFNFPTDNYSLPDALIEALGELEYAPATDELFKLRGSDYDMAATRALCKLAPDRLTGELLGVATDKKLDSYLREQALVTLCTLSATNHVRELIPLLDDVTPIVYSRPMPGAEWRVCDRAAASIATLLGWQQRMMPIFVRPEQRDETLKRVREWAKQTP